MRDPIPHHPTSARPQAWGAIPASHFRALDRRQGLDEKQRTFQPSAATLHRPRSRPPA